MKAILIFAAPLCVVALWYLWLLFSVRCKWDKICRHVADKYSGTIQSNWLHGPIVSFRYGQLDVVIANRKGTVCAMEGLNPYFLMRIPRSGGPRFGESFTTNDTEKALKFFNDPTFRELIQFLLDRKFVIHVDGGYLKIRKSIGKSHSTVVDPDEIESLIWATGKLFDLMASVHFDSSNSKRSKDVQIITIDISLDSLSNVECPVCGSQIDQDAVACRKCKTLHCQACWKYNGQCSTYGCGGTQYEVISHENRVVPTTQSTN